MNLKAIKKLIKTSIPFILGIVILWLLYRNTNIDELWDIAKEAKWGIILSSLIFGLLGNVFRGLRWELMFKPLGYTPKTLNVVYPVLGSYAINFILPRAGEIWRCGVLSKYENIPISTVVGTVFVDRIADLITMSTLLLLCFIFENSFFIDYLKQNPYIFDKIQATATSPLFYLIVAVIIISIYILFKYFKNNKIIKKIKIIIGSIKYDLIRLSQMKRRKMFLLYTFLTWLSYFLYFYLCFFAFDFTKELGVLAGLTIFCMSCIGIAVPVQGGIGAWHFMVMTSLLVYGVSLEQGGAFAGAIFAIQTVWIILCGIVGIIGLPYINKENKRVITN